MPLQPHGQFRRSGLGDERRRRMLSDTTSGPAAAATADRSPPDGNPMAEPKSAHYGNASFMDEQARVTDLIPKRLSVFALLFLGGLTVIVGLVYLYSWMPDLAGYTTDGRVAAFDLDGEGSLAVWVSSTLLNLSALVALLVFSVRRHRTDDYNGRYRVWLWAAMCWLVMSIDETGSVHEGFKEMMTRLAGTRLFGDGSIWWVVPYFFLLGAVGLRLLVDMRECRLSSSALLAAGAAYATSVVAQLGWIAGQGGAREVMIEESAELLGDLLILMAMGLHARFVILDAEGLIKRRAVEKPVEQERPVPAVVTPTPRPAPARTDFDTIRWGEPEPAHPTPEPIIKKPVTAPVAVAATAPPKPMAPKPAASKDSAPKPLAGGLGSHPPEHHEPLSKADKKALRKRLLEMRLERERGGR